MTDTIRWGILGTGMIANKFAVGLSVLDDATLVAVGSRSQATADAFADQYGAPRRYPTYEELAHDPEVDAIYISTPHPYHYENMRLCLEAGKAVLCEKPFTINAGQTAEMIALAREKKLFLMEAMWTRYLPSVVKVRELLAAGTIGEIRSLYADFSFRMDFDPLHRLFNPDLGGGALLDVGIYPISFAAMVFGQQPLAISSQAEIGSTGVDEQCGMVFRYPSGALALLSAAGRTDGPQEAVIYGTKGSIRVNKPFWVADTITVNGQEMKIPYLSNGYSHEAIEVGHCLRAGKLESDIMPLDETLALMHTLDAIRAQWGMKYPGE